MFGITKVSVVYYEIQSCSKFINFICISVVIIIIHKKNHCVLVNIATYLRL